MWRASPFRLVCSWALTPPQASPPPPAPAATTTSTASTCTSQAASWGMIPWVEGGTSSSTVLIISVLGKHSKCPLLARSRSGASDVGEGQGPQTEQTLPLPQGVPRSSNLHSTDFTEQVRCPWLWATHRMCTERCSPHHQSVGIYASTQQMSSESLPCTRLDLGKSPRPVKIHQ